MRGGPTRGRLSRADQGPRDHHPGILESLAGLATAGAIPARGEFVLVVGQRTGAADPVQATQDADDALATARQEVERLVTSGVARGEAARRVAAATGIPRRGLYAAGSLD